MKASNPVLESYWDSKRGLRSYKVRIDGTSRFLLFTAETLAVLQEQINEATKGADSRDRET
jgi:hypothetical protein